MSLESKKEDMISKSRTPNHPDRTPINLFIGGDTLAWNYRSSILFSVYSFCRHNYRNWIDLSHRLLLHGRGRSPRGGPRFETCSGTDSLLSLQPQILLPMSSKIRREIVYKYVQYSSIYMHVIYLIHSNEFMMEFKK